MTKKIDDKAEARKQRKREYDKAYYEANAERLREKAKAYREANGERLREHAKAYYEANAERLREYAKAYYEANGERLRERMREYNEANREYLHGYSHAYYKDMADVINPKTLAYQKAKAKETAAQKMLKHFMQLGMVRKFPCWECGSEKVEAHHYDYDAPLSVTWLCRKHHQQLHADHRRRERAASDKGQQATQAPEVDPRQMDLFDSTMQGTTSG